jgi:hypothetical protein
MARKIGSMKQLYMWTSKSNAERQLKKLSGNKSVYFQTKQKGREWAVFFGKWRV